MKSIALKIAATLCILSTLMMTSFGAYAQTPERMTIAIPFRFLVGGKMLSAGQYSVKRISQSSAAYSIRSRDGGDTVIVLATASRDGGNAEARLVFNNYGGRYFLSQVWMPGNGKGNQVPQLKAERTLGRELASTNTQPQQVVLLAR